MSRLRKSSVFSSSKRKIAVKDTSRCNSILNTYCKSTNLHGYQYLTNPKNNIFIRTFWSVICVVSGVLCVYLLTTQIVQYQAKRILTSIDSTAHPVWDIPFPAVTICNHNLVYKENTEEFVGLLKFHGIPEAKISSFFSNLTNLIIREEVSIKADFSEYEPIVNILETYGFNTEKLMRKLTHPCQKMLKTCLWQGQEYNCTDVFFSVKTTYGFCCAFNYGDAYYVAEKQETQEDTEFFQKNVEILSAKGEGPYYGLHVTIDAEETQYMSPIKHSYAVNVLVHEPNSYPAMELNGNTVLSGIDMSISLHPQVIESSKLRNLGLSNRDCYFEDEGSSTWSKKYNFLTCTYEKIAMNAIAMCSCRPYYLPFKGNIRFCTILDSICLQENKYNFTQLSSTVEDENNVGKKSNVHCLPQCEITFYELYTDKQFYATYATVSNESLNATSLRVYYRSIVCTKISRSRSITWDTLLALIGGTFSMCLGGSLLSIMEVVMTFVTEILNWKNTKIKTDTSERMQPTLFSRRNSLSHFAAPRIPVMGNSNTINQMRSEENANSKKH